MVVEILGSNWRATVRLKLGSPQPDRCCPATIRDLVSRDGLFKILAKIDFPPTLLSIVKSFHDDMKGTVCAMVPLLTPSTSLVA